MNGWHNGPNDGYFLQNLCYHFITVGRVDDAIMVLTSMLWVEANCKARLVFKMQTDYKDVISLLPEAKDDIAEEKRRVERVDKWANDLVKYSGQWNGRREKTRCSEEITEPEPVLPEVIPSVRIWTNKEIEADTKRMIENPTRLDTLRAFESFVKAESYPLHKHAEFPGFVMQHAYNSAPYGPVHEAATAIIKKNTLPMILRQWKKDDRYSPNHALLRTLERHGQNVYSVEITPDGKRGISGSSDKALRIWHIESGECEFLLSQVASSLDILSYSTRILICIGPPTGKVIFFEAVNPAKRS
jgi:hypothetical protein